MEGHRSRYSNFGYHPGQASPPLVSQSQYPLSVSFQQAPPDLYHHSSSSPLLPYTPSHSNHNTSTTNTLQQMSAPVEDVMHDKVHVEQPVKRGRRRRGEANASGSVAAVATQSSPPSRPSLRTEPSIVIKTKFPVARIKRIMQADEDVGKVAQVTPVIVSKALELFMIALCAKASEQARLRNSKRITAVHLKQAVLAEEQFDFLADIMAKVPDIPLPNENSHGNGSDEENGNGGPPGSAKKPRKPRARKQKDEESA